MFLFQIRYIYYSHCLFSVRWQYTSSNCIYFVIYKMNDMVRNKLVICLWVFTQTTNTTCVDKWHYQRNLPKITQIMKRSCYTAECCASIFPSRAPIPFRTLKIKNHDIKINRQFKTLSDIISKEIHQCVSLSLPSSVKLYTFQGSPCSNSGCSGSIQQ